MSLIRGRSTLEIVIVVVIVALVVALSVGIYAGQNKLTKGKVLIGELTAMRVGISLYKKVNMKNPPSLDVLANEHYEAGDGRRHAYLDKVHRYKGDAIIDPFGQSYLYDAKNGWVQSATKGYERW